MAIYQFYLAAIPRVGLIKKHNQIPKAISISTESGYFEFDADEYWKLSGVASEKIVQEIDKLVNRANWGNEESSFNWKTYTSELDNDARLSVNEKTREIEELSFRADLREKNLKFLNAMIDLANKYDWLLMDRKGNLANPIFNEIRQLIEISNSFKFLQDPEKFLTDLGDGKINIE